MISSAPAVGESVPPAIAPFDLRHAPAHLRIMCEALVQALVDEGPHPFRILRPPLSRKFAACLRSTGDGRERDPRAHEILARSDPRR